MSPSRSRRSLVRRSLAFRGSGNLLSCRPLPGGASLAVRPLVPRKSPRHTRFMTKLAGLLVALAIAGGIYFFYFKKMPTTDSGTTVTQAISLTGVRMDLMQIASAERTFEASQGHCAALDELTSAGAMNLTRTARDGYTRSSRLAHPLPYPGHRPEHASRRSAVTLGK